MEDGRALEVTVKMKGGMGKKRGKKNGTRHRPKANLRKYDQEAVRRMRQISNKSKRSCRERLPERWSKG